MANNRKQYHSRDAAKLSRIRDSRRAGSVAIAGPWMCRSPSIFFVPAGVRFSVYCMIFKRLAGLSRDKSKRRKEHLPSYWLQERYLGEQQKTNDVYSSHGTANGVESTTLDNTTINLLNRQRHQECRWPCKARIHRLRVHQGGKWGVGRRVKFRCLHYMG